MEEALSLLASSELFAQVSREDFVPLLRWLRRKKKKELKAQPLPAEQNKSGAVFIDPLEESEDEADESEI